MNPLHSMQQKWKKHHQIHEKIIDNQWVIETQEKTRKNQTSLDTKFGHEFVNIVKRNYFATITLTVLQQLIVDQKSINMSFLQVSSK